MIRLLTDENFNHHILRGLIRRLPRLDVVLVNDVGLTAASDLVLLMWAATEHRTIITHDIKTMIPDAESLMRQGEPMSGLIVVPQTLEIGRAVDDLELFVECYSEQEMRNSIKYLPL